MPGLRNSKDKTFDKVLEYFDDEIENIPTYADLESAINILNEGHGQEISELTFAPQELVDENKVLFILKEPLVASRNSALSEAIDRLGNSDWIKQGIQYLTSNDSPGSSCPFCQQELSQTLREEILSLYDNVYNERIDFLQKQLLNLETLINLLDSLERINVVKLENTIELSNLKLALGRYREALKGIREGIRSKLHSPSTSIERETTNLYKEQFIEELEQVNNKIGELNQLLKESATEKAKLTRLAWVVFGSSLKEHIVDYKEKSSPIDKAISSLTIKIKNNVKQLEEKTDERNKLRSKSLSSFKIADEINQLLELCHFTSFKIQASTDNQGYRIVRENNEPADVETLSEGERTFITFLYYIRSLGTVPLENEKELLVAVIDDPISSVDGDVMFVVSALLRDLVSRVQRGEHNRVVQVLLLTHNSRFHNEVAYIHRRGNSNNIKFYRLRKLPERKSTVEDCGTRNPIRSAYQQLWDEVAYAKTIQDETSTWLPNTLRRILESYFSTLGGVENLYSLGDSFEIPQQMLHRALVA